MIDYRKLFKSGTSLKIGGAVGAISLIVLSAVAVVIGSHDEPVQQPIAVTAPETYSSVTAGYRHSCGLSTSGTIKCWGDNNYGQSEPPDGSFSSVSAGYRHSCGVLTSGTIKCWGDKYDSEADQPTGSFSSVSAG